MRISLALFASFLALTAVACSDSPSSSSSPTDLCANSGAVATVSANDDYTFTPDTVTITIGPSVCWQNTGHLTHTVSVTGLGAGDLPGGQTLVYTFGYATYPYRCSRHSTMTGTVIVNP